MRLLPNLAGGKRSFLRKCCISLESNIDNLSFVPCCHHFSRSPRLPPNITYVEPLVSSFRISAWLFQAQYDDEQLHQQSHFSRNRHSYGRFVWGASALWRRERRQGHIMCFPCLLACREDLKKNANI